MIIADGMSEDGTRDIVREIARLNNQVKLIDNPGRIASTGLNAAIRAARGQIIVRMDAHTRYAPDYVRQCVSVINSTGADNVGGPWVAQGNGYLGAAIAAAFQSFFAIGWAQGHIARYEGRVDTVYLGCWKKEAFEKFGCFDEELVRNQDDEHNLRIVRAHGKVWQSPTIRSWYHSRESLSSLFKQYMQYGYWKVRVIQKHKIPASVRHLVPCTFLLSILIPLLICGICLPLLHCFAPSSRPGFWLEVLSSGALVLLGLMTSIYAFALMIASVLTAIRTQWRFLPVLPLVFCCYHFGYGIGFLKGGLDFLILKKGATLAFTRLPSEIVQVKS